MDEKSGAKIKINKIGIEFTGKEQTAYGGFSLLAAFFEKINLREVIEKVIPVEERSPNCIGKYGKVLGYMLSIYAGGSRFSHLIYLGSETILSKLFGVSRLPLASTTITRLFGKIKKHKESEEISCGIWEYLSSLIPWREIKKDWLTFDSTVVERYGKQEGVERGYNPKKKGRGCLSPLLGFLNKSKYVVNLWNRPGNVASSNNIIGFFESTWERINKFIEIEGVIADSGFYLREFIELLESRGITYIIAARLYKPLQWKIYGIDKWEEITTGIWVSEFLYKHNDWVKERRYVVVRQNITKREKAMGKQLRLFEIDTREYRYSAWVTNSTESPYAVWKLCRPRANDENTIKELKEDFALSGFSMKRFYSTEAAMILRVFIYNLFVLFRYEILEQKEKINRLLTLRHKYFVMPAILGRDGGEPVLRISTKKQKIRSKLTYLFNRIKQYVPRNITNCNAFG